MSRSKWSPYLSGVCAALLAAGATYYFDPSSGARRRALARDRIGRSTHTAQVFLGKATRDARQRSRGLYQRCVSSFRSSNAGDQVLAERVRAHLGRMSSHPGAIVVQCADRIVYLSGDILRPELAAVLHGIAKLHGVRKIVNRLRVHADAKNIAALQGEGAHRKRHFDVLRRTWSPASRVLAGTVGAGLVVAGLARRSATGTGIAAGGAALFTRSICNRPLLQMIGIRAAPENGVLVQKTIHVYADADEVYSRWRAFESFPQFMSHIKEVRKIDDTHYHWIVDGPLGVPVEWGSEVVADIPLELIRWSTVRGSPVQSTGIVRFEPASVGGTRVHVRMSYRPPGNRVGHTIATLLGKAPQQQLEADLVRFKTFMEEGRAARDASAAAA